MANDKWTIVDLTKVKNKRTYGNYLRFSCPVCGGHAGHEGRRDACINIKTGFGHCFSGSCDAIFITQDKHDELEKERRENSAEWRRLNSRKRVYYHQVDTSKICIGPYPANIMSYLKTRCISAETAHNAHVGYCTRKSKSGKTEGQDVTFLAFQFIEEGEVKNCQYKSLEKEFQFESDCKILPWNITAALGADTLIVTEGMMDALALMECGYQNVISVPNGAGTNLSVFDEYIDFEMKGVETILFAGDMDKAGIKLREEFVRKFRTYQVKIVEWIYNGETLKDGNDMLIHYGKDAVKWCIEHAEEPPMEGILTLADCATQLDDYYKNGIPTGKTINIYGLDHLMHFELGRFIPFTGLPGSGKSTFVDNIVVRLCCQYDWRAAVFSPEKWPTARHYSEYISLITGKSTSEKTLRQRSFERAKKYLDDRIIHIESDNYNTIWRILNRARYLVRHRGVKQVIIDPFNYILLEGRKGEIESTIIAQVVQQCVNFAHEENVLVMLVAHPKKLSSDNVQKKLTLADIYGSMAFYNQADIGVVLYSDEITWTDKNDSLKSMRATWVDVQKMRWKELGQLGKRPIVLCQANNRFYGCRELPGNPQMYKPLDFDDIDWLANDGEQTEIEWKNGEPFL